MPDRFSQYNKQVQTFNTKYKVNFSYEGFDDRILKMKNLSSFANHKGAISNANLAYRNTLLDLYRECIDNVIKNTYQDFDHAQLVRDFEDLMVNYRDYCKQTKNRTAPNKFGKWSNRDIVNNMQEALNTVNGDRVQYVKQQYLSRQVRLRDMRRDLHALMGDESKFWENYDAETYNQTKNSVADISKLMLYRDALAEVIKSRSGWWKANPFNWVRNHAEQRDYLSISKFLLANADIVNQVDNSLYDNVVDKLQEKLDISLQKVEQYEKSKAEEKNIISTEDKKNIEIDDIRKATDNEEITPQVTTNDSPSLSNEIKVK